MKRANEYGRIVKSDVNAKFGQALKVDIVTMLYLHICTTIDNREFFFISIVV